MISILRLSGSSCSLCLAATWLLLLLRPLLSRLSLSLFLFHSYVPSSHYRALNRKRVVSCCIGWVLRGWREQSRTFSSGQHSLLFLSFLFLFSLIPIIYIHVYIHSNIYWWRRVGFSGCCFFFVVVVARRLVASPLSLTTHYLL
jgi:hypothetical protein